MEEQFQERKMEELHWELQRWKSHIQFIEDEMLFIDRLLNSYVFEPRTPNLFERLQNFKQQVSDAEKVRQKLKKLIARYENNIGGILECTTSSCDLAYYKKHDELSEKVSHNFKEYMKLKSDIYNYAGSILKRRKPTC